MLRIRTDRSPWYEPGDWELPKWWTDYPFVRGKDKLTREEEIKFYEGWFVKTVLKHDGGIFKLPIMEKDDGKHSDIYNNGRDSN